MTIKRLSGKAVRIENATQFIAYDDDDFNDDDPVNKDGDTGETIPALDNASADYTTLLKSNDTACSQAVTSNCNVLAPAYVEPTYDITSDTNDNRIFQANIPADDLTSVLSYDFDQIATEDSVDYWTVYIYGSYQAQERPLLGLPGAGVDGDPPDTDNDGNPPDGCPETYYGQTNAAGPNGLGSTLFLEISRPHEYPPNYLNLAVSRSLTMAHEVGHLFGGDHNDQGLMDPSCDRSLLTGYMFEPVTLRRIRHEITHP